jgi:hypothetical protein
MPSDPHMESALAAAASGCGDFYAGLATAVAQVESLLERRSAPASPPVERAVHELGAFAAERVDAERFARMFAERRAFDERSIERVERAHDLLQRLLARGGPYVTRVTPGADPGAAVGAALAEVGRAFAAARSIELARNGSPPGEVADPLAPFPYRRWNRAEKRIAPPLVVEVEGGDLQVGGLTEYLDGNQLLLLVVRGVAPAAPLVRLISPGVTVAQISAGDALASLPAGEGPTVIALMQPGSAVFTHLSGEGRVWQRITVESVPTAEPQTPVGSFSVFQQRQELALLRELSAPPPSQPASSPAPGAEIPASAATPADPADQLAGWLLQASGLTPG